MKSYSSVSGATRMEWDQCRVKDLYTESIHNIINQPEHILDDPKTCFVWHSVMFYANPVVCMTLTGDY